MEMNEDTFWELVSLIDYHPETFYNIFEHQNFQAELVKQELLDCPFKDVVEFDRIYNQKLDDLFLPKIVELKMVGCLPFEKLKDGDVYISNDGFRDFRGWIIAQGKNDYELIKNFKREEEILHFNFHINNAHHSSLEFILSQLYKESYSKPYDEEVEKLYKNYYHQNYFLSFGEIKEQIDWENLGKKYPKMFAKYKSMNEKY